MAKNGGFLPLLHPVGETLVAEHGRGVHARPRRFFALHNALVRRAAGQGRTVHDRAFHGFSVRPRPQEDVAGTDAEQHKEFLQLSAAQRQNRRLTDGVHQRSEGGTPCSRHAVDRGGRPHHRFGGRADDERAAQPSDTRSPLFVRAARIGTHLSAHTYTPTSTTARRRSGAAKTASSSATAARR